MKLIIPLMVAGLDQCIKHMIRNLPVEQVFFRVPGIFELIPSINTGAAFSLLRGNNLPLAFLSLALMVAVGIVVSKTMRLTRAAFLVCMVLLGGGIGNLIDRLLYGGVVDYIRVLFLDFPVFNFADICITCSVFILIIMLLTDRLEEHSGESYE